MSKTKLLAVAAKYIKDNVPYNENRKMVADAILDIVMNTTGKFLSKRAESKFRTEALGL